MTTYNVREFRKNLSKSLDLCTQGEEILIKRNDIVYTLKKKIINTLNCVPEALNTYGCGCLREEGHNICRKHQRT
uniref:Putative antitoxin family protein n=1 Tax=viral metagenome TaxID=1070528 RepID=A0A6M3KH80_9ZZZZ